MIIRHEYRLKLDQYRELPPKRKYPDVELRNPVPADVPVLAELMLDSYRGTIDYAGETLTGARGEMESHFAGGYGKPLAECSWLGYIGPDLVSACLVAWWEKRDCPLISFVMTGSNWKGRQLGAILLQTSLQSLMQAGYTEARAVITEGNLPSEALFEKAGFQPTT